MHTDFKRININIMKEHHTTSCQMDLRLMLQFAVKGTVKHILITISSFMVHLACWVCLVSIVSNDCFDDIPGLSNIVSDGNVIVVNSVVHDGGVVCSGSVKRLKLKRAQRVGEGQLARQIMNHIQLAGIWFVTRSFSFENQFYETLLLNALMSNYLKLVVDNDDKCSPVLSL